MTKEIHRTDPVAFVKNNKTKAICKTPTHLQIFVNDELIEDYHGTDTMHDEWHAIEYKDEAFDVHIYWCEIDEGVKPQVILYSLVSFDDDSLETDTNHFSGIDIEFEFDVMKYYKENFEEYEY